LKQLVGREIDPLDNYLYDQIGNLTQDTKEGITSIEWNGAGKVTKVVKGTTTISFLYDGMGNRVRKFVDKPSPQFDITTYYVRDASGNVMSTYEKTGSGNIKQIEVPLYGSDRVGMAKRSAERGTFTATDTSSRWLGYKMYELKDHLGNVRVVLGDKKTRTTGTNPFQPDVVSYSGYFPFGMQMQEDTWQSPLYRYGYGGKEKDGDIKGEGNSYDYGARMLDVRRGQWGSTDPHASKYPGLSSYNYVANSPIIAIDPDGKDIIVLSAPKGANEFGHAALLVGSEATGWRLYSKNGTKELFGTFGFSDDDPEPGIPFNSLSEFANSPSNFYGKTDGSVKYESGYRIKTSADLDQAVMKAAEEEVKSFYNVLCNSCIDVVSDPLSSRKVQDQAKKDGISLDPGYETHEDARTGEKFKTLNPIPNIRYKTIIKNNPGGTDVTKDIQPNPATKELQRSIAPETKSRREETKLKSTDKAPPDATTVRSIKKN